jgi:hypothetical protein
MVRINPQYKSNNNKAHCLRAHCLGLTSLLDTKAHSLQRRTHCLEEGSLPYREISLSYKGGSLPTK